MGAVIDYRLRQYLSDSAPEIAALPPRFSDMDAELYQWAQQIRQQFVPAERELRKLEHPLPLKGIVEGRDSSGVDLRGRDLSNLRFVNCDFTGAALDNADMHRTVFRNTRLVGAKLKSIQVGCGDGFMKLTQFNDCDLSGGDFSGAHLERTKFVSTNMTGVDLTDTEIVTADFSVADLSDAVFDGAVISEYVTVCECPGRDALGA